MKTEFDKLADALHSLAYDIEKRLDETHHHYMGADYKLLCRAATLADECERVMGRFWVPAHVTGGDDAYSTYWQSFCRAHAHILRFPVTTEMGHAIRDSLTLMRCQFFIAGIIANQYDGEQMTEYQRAKRFEDELAREKYLNMEG